MPSVAGESPITLNDVLPISSRNCPATAVISQILEYFVSYEASEATCSFYKMKFDSFKSV